MIILDQTCVADDSSTILDITCDTLPHQITAYNGGHDLFAPTTHRSIV